MPDVGQLRSDLLAAERQFEAVRHGRNAFLGSSAWNDYVFARAKLEKARAALSKAEAA